LNWPVIRSLSHVQIGAFLALMLVVMAPLFTPRLPSVLLGLLGGWLVWTQRSRLFAGLAVRRLAWIFALMLIPILLSIPASFDGRQSLLVATAVTLYFLAGLALVHVLRGDAQRLWLAKWLTIAMLVWMVDGLIQYVVGRDLLGYPLTANGRLTGVFRGNLGLSTILAILMPIAAWYFMRKRPLVVPVLFVGAGVVAVLVGTRNALAMLGVVAVGTSLSLPRRFRPALIVAALLVVGAIGLSPVMQERLQRAAEVGTITFQEYDYILSRRLTIWETAGNMVVDRPLTGVGAGMFARAYDRYSTRPDDPFRSGGAAGSPFHAHNVYVSIAAETGILGLLCIVTAFVLCVKWYYAAPPARRAQVWPYSFGLLIVMFPFSIEYGMYTLWLFPLQLLLLSAMLAALGDDTAAEMTPASPSQ
jgi:O-antigen ligase